LLRNRLPAMVEALEEAIARYGKPEIMNTDQGSQYTGAGWITTLTKADIKISMPPSVCMQTPAGNRRSGTLLRQHLHRTVVAVAEAGGCVFARVNRWVFSHRPQSAL
jgi:transposase InsO family protein